MNLRSTFKILGLSAALAFATNGLAQESMNQQAQPQTIEVNDQQLQQFADAQREIAGIQQEFAGRLQEVEDPEKAQELQRQANDEMTSAVEEAGLDVESFNEIAMAIQNDPELQQQLTEILQQ